ncbi:MAG TPA: hypothetical protein VKR81_10530, partial [Candidatus Binatia bacterium]|nr:hypothetical protein [Candidatus Binatia bacterium]
VMIGLYYGSINFTLGYLGGMKAFTAAVLGGIGNVAGAMAGGLLLGVIEALGAGYFSTEYKDVYAFFILIAVLSVTISKSAYVPAACLRSEGSPSGHLQTSRMLVRNSAQVKGLICASIPCPSSDPG